jgi:hypothetical protein
MNESDNPVQVLINLDRLKSIHHVLRDAGEVIRCFYPGANWAERKGMKLAMDEIDRAEEMCLEVIRPTLDLEKHQDAEGS